MASLLTLPHEPLAYIAELLYARNPRPRNQPVLGGERVEPPNRVAVSRLSKTCRQLRHFGQAELFTSITCRGDLAKAIQLIRTLISRPELGARVREVILSELQGEKQQGWPRKPVAGWQVTEEDAAALNEALRRFDVRSLTDEAGEEVEDGVALTFQAVTKAKAPRYLSFENSALAALAILHSPNVDRIALHTDSWKLPHFVTPAGTFDNLAEVTLEPSPGAESTTMDGGSLQWLMSAAPNLERFYGFIVSEVEGGCLHNGVTDVLMGYCALSDDCIRTIVKMFPNMTSFTYSSDAPPRWSTYSEATPSEIIDAMLPLKNKLTSLTLDWNFSPSAEDHHWDEDEISMAKLSQMVALKHLNITSDDVIKDESEDESESESEDEDEDEQGQVKAEKVKATKPVKESPHIKFLRSIMAPNLETLALDGIPRGFKMMPFADIAAASYPSLKTIYVGYYCENLADDVDIVKAYFKERGIDIE
jgi:hypothetical protein